MQKPRLGPKGYMRLNSFSGVRIRRWCSWRPATAGLELRARRKVKLLRHVEGHPTSALGFSSSLFLASWYLQLGSDLAKGWFAKASRSE